MWFVILSLFLVEEAIKGLFCKPTPLLPRRSGSKAKKASARSAGRKRIAS